MKKKYRKDIHHLHDKSYKSLFSNKEIALDLFQKHLNKDWAYRISVDDLMLVEKTFITSDYEETEADLVYKANIDNTEIIFYILIEFQSTVDYRMPLRLLFYICEILRYYSKDAKHSKSDKNLKIPAIVPIVLYNGTEVWDVPTNLRDIIYNEELFGDSLINFKYDVIDVNNGLSKSELLEKKNISSVIFLLDQKVDVIEFFERIKEIACFFNKLGESEKKSIKTWIKNSIQKEVADPIIEILENNGEDFKNMVANNAFVLDESLAKSREKGELEGKESMVIEMLKNQEPIEKIIKYSKFSEEKILEIKEENNL